MYQASIISTLYFAPGEEAGTEEDPGAVLLSLPDGGGGGGGCKKANFDPVGLGLRVSISNRVPDDVHLRTILCC